MEDIIKNKDDFTLALNTQMAEKQKILYETYFKEFPDLLSIEKVCELFGGIGKRSVYQLIKSKKIKHSKIGREYRISKIHVLEFLGIIKTTDDD